MDCTIDYSPIKTVNDAIYKLANNNRRYGLKLVNLVKSPNFDAYLTKQGYGGVSKDKIESDKLATLIENYYKTQVIDPARTTKVKNKSTIEGFKDNNVLNDSREYFADSIGRAVFILSQTGDKRAKDWKFLLKNFYRNVAEEIKDRAIQVLGKEYEEEFNKIRTKIGYNAAIADAVDKLKTASQSPSTGGLNYERNLNFIALYNNMTNNDFIEYCKAHTKISRIFKDYNEEQLDNVVEEYENLLDEDSITVENTNDEAGNTGQWNWGDNIKDFNSLISSTVKNYFDSLPVLQSAEYTVENGEYKYDIDYGNSIGTPRCMSYQQVSSELFLLAQEPDIKASPEKFLEAIKYLANTKRKFACFIKLYNDMIDANGQINSFGRRIYSEFVKPSVDVAVMQVLLDGSINMTQSNNDNNGYRKLYYQLYDDLKVAARNSIIFVINDRLDEIEPLSNNIINFTNQVSRAYYNRQVSERINAIKYIYKSIFPSIDLQTIDDFVSKNTRIGLTNEANTIENLNILLDDIKRICNKLLDSNEQYRYNEQYNAGIRKRNHFIDEQNKEAAAMGQENFKQKDFLEYRNTDYCTNLFENVATITNRLIPYAEVSVNLNYHDVNGHNVSGIQYNNFISNLVSIFKYADSANAKMEDLMRTNEFQYSNILIDDPEHGIHGLFRRVDGRWQLSPYFDKIINSYFMGGISNMNNGKSVTYANMSNSDYFYYNYTLFSRGIRSYRSYNTSNAKTNEFRTAPFLLTIPSDAPKNYIFEVPVYNSRELFGMTEENINERVNKEIDNITVKADLTGYQTNIGGMKYGKSTATETELISTIFDILETDNAYKVSQNNLLIPNGVTNIKEGFKAGERRRFVIKYINPATNNVFRFIFEGTIKNNFGSLGVDFEGGTINYVGMHCAKSDTLDSNIREIAEDFIKLKISKEVKPEVHFDSNNKSAMATQLRNVICGEIQAACRQRQYFDKEGKPTLEAIRYFDEYHHKKGKFVDGGTLLGNIFHYHKLHNIIDADGNVIIDVDAELQKIVPIAKANATLGYSNDSKGNTFIDNVLTPDVINQIDAFLAKWIDAFYEHTVGRIYNQYATPFNINANEANKVDYMTLFDMMMNATLFDIKMDDLSHGDTAFYKDVQTFVKRSKEEQAGGILSSGANFTTRQVGNTVVNPFMSGAVETDTVLQLDVQDENGNPSKLNLSYNRNGERREVRLKTAFTGVTIENIIRPVTTADNIYKRLKQAGLSDKRAEKLAKHFGYNGGETTKVDDAQSYITFPEACRRIMQLGLWDEYKDLIRQIDDPNIPISEIDYSKVSSFMQVFKNYYYNQHFNETFKVHSPVQIKNAEFILIPKFIAGTQLEDLHQWMLDNDIDQLNTKETSKASNSNVLNIRDKEDDLIDLRSPEVTDWLSRPDSVSTYSYNYLYRQQAVVSHLVDRTNKAGIQIMKKIIDNCPNNLVDDKNNFIQAYVANIKESFENLYNEFGINFDENYNINGDDVSINWDKFNQRAIEECQRLGLDSNAIDAFRLNPDIKDTYMPTCMSIMGNKLESVALSIVNNAITRQTLKGGHLTQIVNTGMVKHKKLKYITDDQVVYNSNKEAELYGYDKPLRYYPADENGNILPIVEVKLPRWTAALLGININQIVNNSEITKFIGYRIPTEGKQSTAILKVVGFLPEGYDSTIAVPDGWITQTGSDFDVDSIYTIMPHLYKDKKGVIKQVSSNIGRDEVNTWNRYVNYVNANVEKAIKKANSTNLTEEEKSEAIKREKAIYNEEHKEDYDRLKSELPELMDEESYYYKQFKDYPNIKKEVDRILKNKSKSYTDRITELLDYFSSDAINEQTDSNEELDNLISNFYSVYEEIQENINEYNKLRADSYFDYSELLREVGNDKFKKAIRDRAKAAGIMTFEEFSKLTPIEQLSREGRENLLIKSAMNIMEDITSAEETLMRSQFETLTEAKKAIDEKKKLSSAYHSPYMFEDKIYYRNNSMSGAQLKGLSVFLDSFTSIANQAHAKFDNSITFTIAITDDVNIEELKKAYDKVDDNKDGTVTITTSNIGWSGNNRNFVGDLITVSASETTAHILDAVKEGAVENENNYTFAPFKMLLMMGLDHYTAQLWLRQPAIMEIGNAFNATQSSFLKYNLDPINIAIRNIAKKFRGANGTYATGTTTPVDDNTPIETIIDTLDKYFAPEGKKSTNLKKIASSIKVDARTIDKLYTPVDSTNQDAVNERVKEELLQILMFKNIKGMANKVVQYESILAVDKYGAKSNFYDIRNVFRNIYDIINNTTDFVINGDDINNNREANLLESIFPGISKIAIANKIEDTNAYETRSFYDIHQGIKEFLKENNKKKSSYPIINAHMRYGCAPAYLVFHKKFETESPAFVESITYLEELLGSKLDAATYNQFKKYILNDCYRRITTMARSLEVKNDGSIDYRYDENGQVIDENVARIYGYITTANPVVTFQDANNPTDEEYAKFLELSPAAKLVTLQGLINSDEDNIFSYLKANMYNAWEVKDKGVSSQRINFDDQNNNIDYIHKLFEQAINNENKLVRATAIDLIKYSFFVEGYSYGRGKVSKTINNASFYGGSDVGGLDIITTIRENVKRVNKEYVEKEQLADNFIRSHSDIKNIPVYYFKNRPVQNYENANLSTFYFDFNNGKFDKHHALTMKVARETKDGNIVANGYFKISNGKREILYKTEEIKDKATGKLVAIYCYPLNKLNPYEYKTSVVTDYNRYAPQSFYETYYEAKFNDESTTKDEAFYKKYNDWAADEIRKLRENVTPPVEDNHGLSLTYLADNISNPSIKSFLDTIEKTFAKNPKDVLVPIWQAGEFGKIFTKFNTPYEQVVDTGNGERNIYTITRKRNVDISKQVKKKNHNALYDTLNKHGIKSCDDIYTVRKAKVVFNENDIIRESSINIEDIKQDNVVELSNLGKVNKQMYETVVTNARQHKDQDALKTLSRLSSNGIDFDYVEGIENKLETSTNILVGYFNNKSSLLKQKIEQFCQDDDGNYVSIDDKYVLDRLMSDDEDFRSMFLNTFLECATFGDRISDLRYLSTDNLSETTKKNIVNIINTIDEIKNNTKLYNAIKSYIDKYIGSKSLNKYIKEGTFTMSDWVSTDLPALGKMFLDPNEITDPLIQNVLKMVNVDMMEGRMAADENVANFTKAWNTILQKAAANGVIVDMSKVINENNNTIKEDYTDEFLKDRKAQQEAYNHAKRVYNPYDKEYIRAKHAYDTWKYENEEQKYVASYYKEKLDNEAKMMTDENFDTYCEYLRLKERLRSLYNMEKDKYIMKEIQDANRQIRQLRNEKTVDGIKKVGVSLRTAKALREYIRTEEAINKKYNEETPVHEFEQLRDKYLDTIHKITYPNGTKIPIPVSQREENPAYREAMDWLRNNAVRRLPKEFSNQLNDAFEELRGEKGRNDSAMYGIIDEHPEVDFYDANGIIDGRKFSKSDAAVIKANQSYNNEGTDTEIKLIRNRIDEDYVYTREFYNCLRSNESRNDKERNEIVLQINDILGNVVGSDGKVYVSYLSVEDLRKLDELYIKLTLHDRLYRETNEEVAQFIKDNVTFKEDVNFIKVDKQIATEQRKKMSEEDGNIYWELYNKVTNGYKLTKLNNGAFVVKSNKKTANRYIFSYATPKRGVKSRFIDEKRTNAKNFIKENVYFTTTPYYEDARKKALDSGNFDEWFKANHVWNPYTQEMEPLRIWTTMETKESSSYRYEYVPNYLTKDRDIKEEYKNPNYKNYGANWNGKNYREEVPANEYERQLRELMLDTLNQLAYNDSGRRYADKRVVPFKVIPKNGLMGFAQQAAKFFGADASVDGNRGQSENIGYAYDRDSIIQSMEQIHVQGERKYKEIPKQLENESNEEYAERIKEIEEYNKEVREYNEELKRKVTNKDYKGLFEDFVRNATINKYLDNSKNHLYMVLEWYRKYKEGYDVNILGNLRVNHTISTKDHKEYKRKVLSNNIELIENYIRRIYKNQFRAYSGKLDELAALAQRLTSAKYMMLNITGATSNVLTGRANIAMETWANQYFTNADWFAARGRYMMNIPSYLLGAFSDKAVSLEDGIFKLFNIIDFDRINEAAKGFDTQDKIWKMAVNFAYSPQSAGEHYMQNGVLLTMLMNHHVIEVNGKCRIIDKGYARYEAEYEALKDVVENNPSIKIIYDNFIKRINEDDALARDYQSYRRNLVEDFFALFRNTNTDRSTYNNLIEQYLTYKKEFMAKFMEQFDKSKPLIDYFELVDGRARLKEDNDLTLRQLAEFGNKVQNVNKYIHGVYDRYGAAYIESSSFLGGLIMQFHKHIPNGILKYFRLNGYFNENTGLPRRGIIASIGSILSKEYIRELDSIKNKYKDNPKDMSIVDKTLLWLDVIARGTINTFKEINTNYQISSELDKANLRRALSNLAWIGYMGVLAIAAGCILYDDDDSYLGNWMLYSADRTASEIAAFTFGLGSEFRKMSNNPIAYMSTLNDINNVLGIVFDFMINGEEYDLYYHGGQYSGENKLAVMALRQIPIYRSIDRFINLQRNNRYYKLGDNALSLLDVNSIAEWVME